MKIENFEYGKAKCCREGVGTHLRSPRGRLNECCHESWPHGWFLVGPMVGSWLVGFMVGSWSGPGWVMVGSWLVHGWFVVGFWLVSGWFLFGLMVGLWMVCGWFLIGWFMVGSGSLTEPPATIAAALRGRYNENHYKIEIRNKMLHIPAQFQDCRPPRNAQKS
jgi:hypothetical protein